MHPELAAIIELWDNVHEADTLQIERAACVDGRRLTSERKKVADTEHEAKRVALDEVRTEERRVMRKLDSYRKRVKTTRTMIEAGKAPDYRLAEQQLRSCIQIVDDLETEALELMEQRDDAEALFDKATQASEAAEQAAVRAITRERDRIPAIDRQLEELDLQRPPLEKALTLEHKGPFRTQRARKRGAVARFVDGACKFCNFATPSQVANEINGNLRVHRCSNCGRFLVPEPSTDA